MDKKLLAELVETMGLAAQADGLPRIAGRIFGFFLAEGGTRSFSEIAQRLQISRGSVSTNVRLLESLGLIERTFAPGDRQDDSLFADDPYVRLHEGYLARMQRSEEAHPRMGSDDQSRGIATAVVSKPHHVLGKRTGVGQ